MSHSQKIGELSPAEKRQLLADLLRKKAQSSQDWQPLSYGQQALWLIYKLAPESTAYNIGLAMRLHSSVDFSALKNALQTLIDRHSMLRVTFKEENGKPLQFIQPHLVAPWEDVEATGWSEEQLKEQVREKHHQPFDLEQEPVVRVTCFNHSDVDYVLLLTFHHIACDGWSIWLLLDELKQLYIAESKNEKLSLPPVNSSYLDYVHSQKQMLKSAVGEDHWKYWQKKLEGELPLLNLPTDYPRPAIQTYQGASCSFQLSPQLSQQLKTLAKTESVTPYILLLAAFQVLLYRYSGSEDILIGSPTSGRTNSALTYLVGYLVNSVVLRAKYAGNPKFSDFLAQVRQTVAEAIAHQDYPFPLLVEQLHPHRDPSYSPLFQVDFVLQQSHLSDTSIIPSDNPENTSPIHWGNLILEPFPLPQQEGQFDLSLEIFEGKDNFRGSFKYNKDLFKENTIQRLSSHFQNLLEGIVTNPQEEINQLPLLTALEKQQILCEWNQTDKNYNLDQTLHQLVEKQAEKSPQSIALIFENQTLTYKELNHRANQLAHYLQELGVDAEVLVGIYLERSLEMVIGLLAILKAGGAYVPIDPDYPQERLSYMLEDSQISVLLTQEKILKKFTKNIAQIICLDRDGSKISTYSIENPKSAVTPKNLAYVIYTSGSTGKPKGVLITHHNVVRLFKATEQWFNFNANDSWTLFHSYAFDFSVWEIWGALLYGGKLVIVPYLITRSPQEFSQLLLKEKITILNQTPSSFRQLIRVEETRDKLEDMSLRWVIFGGEALELQSLKPWFERHGDQKPQLVNMYGITETTVHVTYRPLTLRDIEQKSSLIGSPIPDLQVYILNSQQQLVPVQVPGEMYIAGAGLAQGYLNRPELTAQRFMANPFSDHPQSRLYKTGDLARYLEKGEIEYLGRIDHQVKIRGFRIELGEIESILNTHPEVKESVVIVREDQPNNPRLVAYLVSNFIPERFPYQQNCWVEVEGQKLDLHTEDISPQGLGLVGANFTQGQKLKIELILPAEKDPCCLTGIVAWSESERAGIALNLSPYEAIKMEKNVKYLWEHSSLLKILQRTITAHLQKYLKEKLPDYMIPSAFVLLDRIPLTANGKVNRQALPAPSELRPELQTTFVKPESELEILIAQVWREVLHLEQVGIHDNFFDLGGHSLLIIQVQNQLQERLKKPLSMVELFQYPTINALAKHLSQAPDPPDSSLTQESQPISRNVRGNYQQHQRQLRKKHRSN